jgi:cytochrome c oxidase assembly factor CtaG
MKRDLALIAGIAIALATVLPPLEPWALRTLTGHMVQHLLDTDIIPPLVFFGAPELVRPFRIIPAPIALFASIALIWGIHFGPLFNAALESAPLQALVHVLFLTAGALLWAPVFDAQRLSTIARLGYVFIAMPFTGFLGFVIYSARSPLYAQYVRLCGSGALADQQSGGELMWVGGSTIMFAGFMVLAFEYARQEIRIASESAAGSS